MQKNPKPAPLPPDVVIGLVSVCCQKAAYERTHKGIKERRCSQCRQACAVVEVQYHLPGWKKR